VFVLVVVAPAVSHDRRANHDRRAKLRSALYAQRAFCFN
jgi:hypothetical protein